MYTSDYSSSPIRSATSEFPSTNYQYQSYHQESYQSNTNDNNTMNDSTMGLRRDGGGYPHSIASLASTPLRAPTSPRPHSYNYRYSPNDLYRYQSTSNLNSDFSSINDGGMGLRRDVGGFSNSVASLTSTPLRAPTTSRPFSHNYHYSPSTTNVNRYPTTNYPSTNYPSTNYPPANYPSSYRPYGYDSDTYRPNTTRFDTSGQPRAYSYDDLYYEQNRYPTTSYNTRSYYPFRQGQYVRPYRYDDDYEDLVVKSTDLPATLEQDMIELVRTAFQKYDIRNQRELAGFLKRSADKSFQPCWHCIVGKQFSSYVTHEMNGFIYFTKGALSILLFKSGA